MKKTSTLLSCLLLTLTMISCGSSKKSDDADALVQKDQYLSGTCGENVTTSFKAAIDPCMEQQKQDELLALLETVKDLKLTGADQMKGTNLVYKLATSTDEMVDCQERLLDFVDDYKGINCSTKTGLVDEKLLDGVVATMDKMIGNIDTAKTKLISDLKEMFTDFRLITDME